MLRCLMDYNLFKVLQCTVQYTTAASPLSILGLHICLCSRSRSERCQAWSVMDPKTKILWRQYPICAGYAFANHKAQGQTLEHVLIDIGTTKKFPVTPFSAYVALSRSRGRDSVRLLRDFDDTIFTKHPSEDLRREDERLKILIKTTTARFETGYYEYE